MKRFENKVVIVTGAGGGIGSDAAISFAAEGAKVAVVDFNGETAHETVKKITDNGGQAKTYVCDVTDFHAVEKCVNDIVADFGCVDVLANIAGGSARKDRALSYEPVAGDFRQNYQGQSLRQLLFRPPVRESHDRKKPRRQDNQYYFGRGGLTVTSGTPNTERRKAGC